MRIAPLPRREWGAEEIDALAPMTPPPDSTYAKRRAERGGAGGVGALALMLRNPAACRAFLEFNRHLLYESSIDERLRELVVMRLAWVLRSEYEWGQHAPVARECGLSDADLDRIIAGPDADGWSILDAAALRATDGLLASGEIDDASWATLAEHFDEAALLDFVFTVGGYATVAMVFNAAGLPLDADIEGFPHHDK